jgi:hypothetical protein
LKTQRASIQSIDSRAADGVSLTEAERTHWLVTFTELAYVASMIKLGHFLEYEKNSWSGWITAWIIFYSFWSTWAQMASYQAHMVDTGVLEKLWAFMHCFSMLLMGSFVNAFHQESIMNPNYGTTTVDKYSGGGDDDHRLLAGCSDDGHSDYQVRHPAFVYGLVLSRWTLCSMYAATALSAEPKFRRLMFSAASIFLASSLVLLGVANGGISADSTCIFIAASVTFEFVGLYVLTRYPAVWGVKREDVSEVQYTQHTAHSTQHTAHTPCTIHHTPYYTHTPYAIYHTPYTPCTIQHPP